MTLRNRIAATVGSLLISLIMLLLIFEVLSRFIFGASIEGVIEIVGIFLALSVFAGFSPCEEAKQHVRAELVVQRLPAQVARVFTVAIYIVAIITVAVMSWQTALDFFNSFSTREALPGARVQVPVYWAKGGVFVGFVLLLIQLIVSVLQLYDKKRKSLDEKA